VLCSAEQLEQFAIYGHVAKAILQNKMTKREIELSQETTFGSVVWKSKNRRTSSADVDTGKSQSAAEKLSPSLSSTRGSEQTHR
jgi:hypothetical protein